MGQGANDFTATKSPPPEALRGLGHKISGYLFSKLVNDKKQPHIYFLLFGQP